MNEIGENKMSNNKQAPGNLLLAVSRETMGTVPNNLTDEEAGVFLANRGIFEKIENLWLTERTQITNTLHYKKYAEWASLLMGFVLGPIFNGFTLSVLWKWFMVEPYGVPLLSIPIAVGIMLMVGVFTSNLKKNEWSDRNYQWRFWRIVTIPFLKILFFLGMGWVFHLFI